jgi:hypothetical protein
MKAKSQFLAAIALSFFVLGFGAMRPDVPNNLKAPANEDVVLSAHATGEQIYICKADQGQKPAWILEAPKADLTDATGKVIIHHSAGPTWKHIDGSQVTGKVIAKQDAPQQAAIPWLLLSTATHTGDGILARVTTIQRIHTEAGLPPSESDCNAEASGKQHASSYSADYYFYAPAKK